jgi:hypothetical protein
VIHELEQQDPADFEDPAGESQIGLKKGGIAAGPHQEGFDCSVSSIMELLATTLISKLPELRRSGQTGLVSATRSPSRDLLPSPATASSKDSGS